MSAKLLELIEYRDMQLKDLDIIYDLEVECYDFPWTRNILRDCFLNGYDFYIATYERTVIGYVISKITSDESHILNLTVKNEYRNIGVASGFIDMICDKCTILESKVIFLETRTTNYPAIGLYEKYGFKRVSIRKDYYKTYSGKENAIIFRKILT